jgi:glycosyltransferase involved in cell wall biosynthesis
MGIALNSPRKNRQETRLDGFHLIGFLSGGFGLGEAARHTLRRMIQQNIPVVARDVDTMDHRLGQVQEFSRLLEKRPGYWPGRINLFHINPSEFESLLIPQWPKTPLADRLNVIVPFWELPILPPQWRPCLQAMDAVLAPTEYIRDVVQKELPGKPVLHFPQSIPVVEIAEPDRARFGLPEDAFVFLCAFDIMSDIERKNPWGSMAAFQKAFPDTPGVRLILKINNAHILESLKKLEQAAANDSRILILKETLPRETLKKLYASCDALISLHRAEGLGLIIMEMMMQAKPVIVTAWSGNMDFTTPENACLVDFVMVPVNSTHPSYKHATTDQNTRWAEADIDCAADWMKKLTSDSGFREQIGRNARKCMLERAEIDGQPVFEQLQALYKEGLRRNREQELYVKTLLKSVRKRQKRRRIQKIEKAVKKIFRPTVTTSRP